MKYIRDARFVRMRRSKNMTLGFVAVVVLGVRSGKPDQIRGDHQVPSTTRSDC